MIASFKEKTYAKHFQSVIVPVNAGFSVLSFVSVSVPMSGFSFLLDRFSF